MVTREKIKISLIAFVRLKSKKGKYRRYKTPKYCGHYRYFFLVITITELKYANLTLILMNIEKGLHSLTKKESDKELNPEPTACKSDALLLNFRSTSADRANTHL